MKTITLSTLVLALSIAACGPGAKLLDFDFSEQTVGQRGAVSFSTHEGASCLFGCGVTAPLAVGAVDVIAVRPHTAETGLSLVSSDPAVLGATVETSFTCCSGEGESKRCVALGVGSACSGAKESVYRVVTSAKGAGSAYLRVLHADGSELDQVRIAIAVPTSVRLEEADDKEVPAAGLSRKLGSQGYYNVRMLDANGVHMRAPGLTLVRSSDVSIVAIVPAVSTVNPESGAQTGGLHALKAGFAQITVVGGAPVTVTVTP